jgi:hypothetical protein
MRLDRVVARHSELRPVGIQNVARDLLSPTPSLRSYATALRSAKADFATMMGAQNVRRGEPFDILSAEIARDPFCASPNSAVGTKWILVPKTYTPPRGSTELEFRIREQVVGRERSVSRVRFSPIQTGRFEYRTTPNDTARPDAVGY